MKNALRLWALLLIFKLLVSAWLPMSPDEAYYWVWSKHLQLSYYDHPAMVAWLFRLGDPFLGLARAVRWPSVLIGHGTLLVWLILLREMLSEKQLCLFLGLASFSPMIGIGSVIVTPDVPLVFFWSSALLCLKEALSSERTWWYALLGASLGLGFCSKYQIVLFVPILAAWLIFEGHWREVHWRKALLTVVVGLLFCFPVLYWNWQNGFASFRFQLDHGLGQKTWNPDWTLEYIGGQIILIFPLVLYVLVRKSARITGSWLFYFAWGPVLFFLLTSLRGPVEANWPIAAYPSLFALAVVAVDHVPGGLRALNTTMVIWLVLFLGLISALVAPLIPLAVLSDRFAVMEEYHNLTKFVELYHPLYTGNYQIASVLSFDTQKLIYKARGYSRKDFFDSLPESLPTEPEIYVIIEKEQWPPETLLAIGYKQVDRLRLTQHHFLVKLQRQ